MDSVIRFSIIIKIMNSEDIIVDIIFQIFNSLKKIEEYFTDTQ